MFNSFFSYFSSFVSDNRWFFFVLVGLLAVTTFIACYRLLSGDD